MLHLSVQDADNATYHRSIIMEVKAYLEITMQIAAADRPLLPVSMPRIVSLS